MSKLLVTYFSAGGVTARAARNLAQAVGAALGEVTAVYLDAVPQGAAAPFIRG